MDVAGSSEIVVTIYEIVHILNTGLNSIVIASFTITVGTENSETLVTLKRVIFRFVTPCNSKRS
jgi:hypothetical protein